jgi:TPR repeat protein
VAHSYINIGAVYDIKAEYDKALEYYQKAADQGHANAQYNLGGMYGKGQGVGQDFREAIKWWRKAADLGFADAQYNLGVMYGKGQGVEKEGIKWLRKAAEKGNEPARAALKRLSP